jgi:lysozyme family protein
MALFDEAFEHLIGVEGRYSCHPSDPGGATCWGVTAKVARANGYTGPMDTMPIEAAKAIYKRLYWDALSLDGIGALSPHLATELFDSGVNCGPGLAAKWLQTALNAFNRRGRDYPEIPVDGQAGQKTVAAVAALKRVRGDGGMRVLFRAVDSQQGAHYIAITKANEALEDFAYGWFDNRIGSGL